MHTVCFVFLYKAFINTAKEIYQKIQEGVFDINNEVGRCAYIYRFMVKLVMVPEFSSSVGFGRFSKLQS